MGGRGPYLGERCITIHCYYIDSYQPYNHKTALHPWKAVCIYINAATTAASPAKTYPLRGLSSARTLPINQHTPLAAVVAQLAPKRAQAHLTGAGKAVRPKCPCGAQANRTRHASAIDDYRMSNLVWRSGNLPLRYRDCVVLP